MHRATHLPTVGEPASTFVDNYKTEQPILELARVMNLPQQKAVGGRDTTSKRG